MSGKGKWDAMGWGERYGNCYHWRLWMECNIRNDGFYKRIRALGEIEDGRKIWRHTGTANKRSIATDHNE